jgi:hypothetical protein
MSREARGGEGGAGAAVPGAVARVEGGAMKVQLRCEHRTLTLEAEWDDLSPVYAADRVRAMLLTCPACHREADVQLEGHERLTIQPEAPDRA